MPDQFSASQVRQRFIDYFVDQQGHRFVPSSPVVPHDDPTLLFTNAGMNQFKPAFLDQVLPGSQLEGVKRASNSQKCIRAGGKHNDLEDVGHDTYHHTFFEMLGNWSFGDYFKDESIEWAWTLLTDVFGLPKDRMYATYFGGNAKLGLDADEEARQLWLRFLPPERVLPFGMKDNFWEMGETGPCGPCSEIHFDRIGGRDASKLVNADDPDVIELWNLVFIQYDRRSADQLVPLPAKHVDTGMGLERLVSVLQDKRSNYDTDVFTPLFEAIAKATSPPRAYGGKLGEADTDRVDTAYRVIADHIRTLVFAITDGAVPSNDGRGYVLRRILRRAVRYGRQMLGGESGFLSALVPAVVEQMGDAFPELRKNPMRVVEIIREEEESFGRTLDRGIGLFEEAAANAKEKEISGEDAFKLYDTFGFPLDLTELMAHERGLNVDVEGFERSMLEQKERSRAASKEGGEGGIDLPPDAIARLRHMRVNATEDVDKYHARDISGTVKAIWDGRNFEEHTHTSIAGKRKSAIILDKTNFYAEQGGQAADNGRLMVTREHKSSVGDANVGGEFRVEDVRSFGGYVLHIGHIVRGELRVGDQVHLHIDNARRNATAANHTATHLLNFALRRVLGEHVEQKGSLVEGDRLRFDFSHNGPCEPEQLQEVESIVRRMIEQDLTVFTAHAPLYSAKLVRSVRAVFGEQYPDPVRVVSIGQPVSDLIDSPDNPAWEELSVEFCGGTHLESTSEAHAFAIVQETGIAKGVRRIEALTGVAAKASLQASAALEARVHAAAEDSDEALGEELGEVAQELDQLTLPLWNKHRIREAMGPLQERVKKAHKAKAGERRKQAQDLARQVADSAAATMERVVITSLHLGSDREALQAALKLISDKVPEAAVMVFSPDEAAGKVAVVAACPKPVVAKGLKAGDWVRHAVEVCGGKGGGRPEQAQGAGSDVGKLRDAIKAARAFAHKQIG